MMGVERILPGAPLEPVKEAAQLPGWTTWGDTLRLNCETWELVKGPASKIDQSGDSLTPAAVGELIGKHWSDKNAAAAARTFLEKNGPEKAAAVMRWSPFWLEKMSGEQLCGNDPQGPAGLLIRYRLGEMCLALIDLLGEDLAESRVLVTRFCFRALAGMRRSWYEEAFRKIPFGAAHVLAARRAYAVYLLERQPLVERALAAAQPEDGRSWDLDAETKLLIEDEQSGALWPFSDASVMQQQLTDDLLRRGLLARNDLGGTRSAVAAHVNAPEKAGLIRRATAVGMRSLQLLVVSSALLAFFGLETAALTGNQAAAQWLVFAGMGVGALAMVVWGAAFLLLGLRRLATYPLALRVPAMAFLGVLALIGLGNFATFGLRAWDSSGTAWLLAVAGLLAPLGYIFFETQTRVADVRRAVYRSVIIWLYALATVFWLTFWAARFVAPVVICAAGECQTLDRVFEGLGGTPISTDFVLFVTPLALSIGVLTQLFWEETAIAEPI